MTSARSASPSPRRVLLLASFVLAFDGYDLFSLGTVGPVLVAYEPWGTSVATLGVIGAITGIGMPIGAVAGGWLSDRVGRRLPIVLAFGLISLGMLFSATAPTLALFGVARFLTGTAIGAISPLIAAMVSDHAPASSRTLYMASAFASLGLGGAVSAFLGSALLPETHFQLLFLPGVVPLLVLWPLWRMLPAASADLASSRIPVVGAKSGPGALFGAPLRRSTILLWTAMFMSAALTYSTSSWLPTVLLRNGYAMTSSLQFTVAFIVGASVGAVGLALLADRGHLRATAVGAFASAAIVMAILPFAREQSAATVLLLCGMAGIGSLAGQALLMTCMADIYPVALRGTALGFGAGFGRIGAIVGPGYLGIMTSLLATPEAGFYAFALLAGLGALSILALPHWRRAGAEPAAAPEAVESGRGAASGA